MVKYKEFLYDDIGNEYERKNKYILHIAKLNEKIEYASKEEQKKLANELSNFKNDKSSNPYNIELDNYLKKEKEFLGVLKTDKKKYLNTLVNKFSKKAKKYKVLLFECERKIKFYEKYIAISYDASFYYEESKIITNQLPDIIEFLITTEKELKEALEESKKLDSKEEIKIKNELEIFKKSQNDIYLKGVLKLKEKRAKGLISKKALSSEKDELNKKMKSAILVKSYDSPKKSNKELIGKLKYQITKGVDKELKVLNSNISDLRRKTPCETRKKVPIFAYLTALLPGIGQVLNGQYIKSIIFFIVSIFSYFAAIPYALGFGNYQGQGIAGLISLAEGGTKLQKSRIFLIEGVLAIFLLILALVFIYLSFRDVLKVEKDKIKGIRPRSWFETKSSLNEEGFPYMVSLPALLVTIFIVLVPITTAILLSFTGMDPQHQSKFTWVGIENYKLIALGKGIAGSAFWNILGWTVIWTITSTTLAILIGFFLAILVNNERIKGKAFFRAVYLLPWAVPSFVTIMFFSIMFSPKGALTELLNSLLGYENITLFVKNDPILSRITLVLLQGWLGSAYIFLLSTGVLQGIPSDLYEAAQIDGATAWQKLRKITLPLVLFQTAPLLVGQYTFNFNNFSIIYLFNSGGPFNPVKYGNLAGSSDLLISYIYKLTMENQYQSIGAAITIVISLGLMLFAFIGFRNSKAFREERL